MIPFKVLPIDEREVKTVSEVIRSGNLGMGKFVKQFEEEFAKYVGSRYAVAVDSCTSALFLSLRYRAMSSVHPPYVSIPSMTVPLVANTILHAGLEIKFVDECEWVGRHYELAPFNIVDSAHEVSPGQFHGYDNKTLMCFSFYPTKPITSCEGGMICTNDEKAVDWIQKARFYGRNSGSTIAKNSWEYDIEFPGWKMNMTEIQAALGLEQLRKLPEIDYKRKWARDYYNEAFGLNNTSLYLYRIEVPNRDIFVKWMKENGVECGVHFRPLHTMTPFKECVKDDLSKTELMGKTTVSLPLYDSLKEDDLQYIVDLVKKWGTING